MAIPGNFLSSTTESIDPNTSGWIAKLNCAISLGSGGRNGDGALKLTSTASGEMQARTVSSYEVMAGTVYEAFADASGATVPERIGIRWLDVSNAEISITWSLTTATASATWHRIAVGGAAPATAVRAQVVVSSMTPGAGGVIGYFENVYLGFPITTTGNLFGFNTETSEIDATAWTVETNCTIARQAPMVQWPVNFYLAGGNVIAMTATASANAAMRSTDRPAATAGVEYIAYCYLNPPTAGATVWVELRFYNAGGSQIQATRATLAQPGTGWYRQIVSDVAPALTASCSIAVGIDSATAAQVLRVEGAVVGAAPVINTNGLLAQVNTASVLRYADATFEQGIAGWTVVSGVATLARSTPWGGTALNGSYSLIVSSATATTSVIRSAKFSLGGAATGDNWRTAVGTNVTAGGWTWQPRIHWYDAGGGDLGFAFVATAAVPTPNWWVTQFDGLVPAGATQASVEYQLTATSTSSALAVDRATLYPALPESEVSVSDSTASVIVTMRELDTADTLTVWRVLADGTRTLVRGPDGLLDGVDVTSDILVIEDYEAPLGVPVYYYAEGRDSTGFLVATRTTPTVTITAPNVNFAWLKDPGNPQRNLLVMVAKAPDWGRAITQAEHRVRRRRNSVIYSDIRGGLAGDLQIFTVSDAERAALHWLLDSGDVLLWQAAPGMGISDVYVNVADITEARGGGIAQDQLRVWTLPLKEADMPATVGVAGSAGRTWQDILTEFATWQDVFDAFATWEDVLFNRRIGGG